MRTTFTVLTSLFLASSALTASAVAQQPPERGDSPPQGERPMGPPPEAYEVCDGASADDACAVNTPHGTVEGQCLTDRQDDTRLVCVPERGHGGPGRGHGPGAHDCGEGPRPDGPPGPPPAAE